MGPGARDLQIRQVLDGISCLCDEGKKNLEGEWAYHGWAFHAGQCCDCLNIRVYHNGTSPSDWESTDPVRREYVERSSDEIHICDLPNFILMLQSIQEKKIS